MGEQIKLTKKGYEEKKERLNYLLNVLQPENLQTLKEARAQGDLSENADYDAAKTKQAEINGEIEQIRAILDNYVIIDEKGNKEGKIAIGATVRFANVKDGKEMKFQIVGSQEANPFEGKISDDCILSKSVMGHKKGDKVEIMVENPYTIEILDVTFGD